MINNILEEHPDIIRSEALDSLLSDDNKLQKVEITEDRIKARIKEIRDYVAFWREYPDIFVEFLDEYHAVIHSDYDKFKRKSIKNLRI